MKKILNILSLILLSSVISSCNNNDNINNNEELTLEQKTELVNEIDDNEVDEIYDTKFITINEDASHDILLKSKFDLPIISDTTFNTQLKFNKNVKDFSVHISNPDILEFVKGENINGVHTFKTKKPGDVLVSIFTDEQDLAYQQVIHVRYKLEKDEVGEFLFELNDQYDSNPKFVGGYDKYTVVFDSEESLIIDGVENGGSFGPFSTTFTISDFNESINGYVLTFNEPIKTLDGDTLKYLDIDGSGNQIVLYSELLNEHGLGPIAFCFSNNYYAL